MTTDPLNWMRRLLAWFDEALEQMRQHAPDWFDSTIDGRK